MNNYKITSYSESETVELAQNIESEKFPNMVICLIGDLGSGKTIFTKGLAASLEVKEEITSPTFNIIKEYTSGELPLYHMDVYRLNGNVEGTGIEEYFKRLYHCRGESLDKKKIMEEFKSEMKYNFAKVGGEFNLIEEDTKIILIHCEEEASAILQRIKYQGYTKSEMRKASRYCVQVDSKELGKLRGAGAVKAVSEDMEDFFELVDESMYTETMGLNLEIDSGIAMFS